MYPTHIPLIKSFVHYVTHGIYVGRYTALFCVHVRRYTPAVCARLLNFGTRRRSKTIFANSSFLAFGRIRGYANHIFRFWKFKTMRVCVHVCVRDVLLFKVVPIPYNYIFNTKLLQRATKQLHASNNIHCIAALTVMS